MRSLAEGRFWRLVVAATVVFGLYATIIRFSQGLGASTNLSDGFPWGLWIGFDVLVGVGLAAGGFTITATVHIFDLKRFHPIVRPAVLTAFLGYLLVIVGLLFDLGRPDRVWHPLIMWNPHSVMFEVGWCVSLYTTVLALEFSPIVLEKFNLRAPLRLVRAATVPIVIAGVILSTLHQSSLGTLFVIVPDKLHQLWYSPLLPLLFFISSIGAGLCMVIIESFASSRAFKRHLELDLLAALARVVVVILALYTVIRLQDMHSRGALAALHQFGPEQFLFWIEVGFGAVVPMVLLAIPAVRTTRPGLLGASLLVVLGFVLNRMNVGITGMQSGLRDTYFPSAMEIGVTAMLVALGFIAFNLAARYLDIFPPSTIETSPRPEPRPPRWVSGLSYGALTAMGLFLAAGAVALDFGTAGGTFIAPDSLPPVARHGEPNAVALQLPADLRLRAGADSPGPVTFSHGAHVDTARPSCAACHTNRFAMVPEAVIPAAEMHGASRCGGCHDGEKSFAIEDNCEMCHEGA